MARGKVHLKKIQNPANRRVTFSKRKAGLLKKASELSVLCGAEIGLIIFSPTEKLFEFASPSMNGIIGKYQKGYASTGHHVQFSEHLETLRLEVENKKKRRTHLEKMCKHMIGEDLDLLNFKDIQLLEKKISLSARKIRLRKDKISQEYIGSLKMKDKISQEYIGSLKMKEKFLRLEKANMDKKIGKSHMEGANDYLETDAATQQDQPQTNLNLTLS